MTPETRNAVIERDGTDCTYCGVATVRGQHGADNLLTIDHVIPRSAGGTDDLENLRVACFLCNCRKHRMGVDEFDPKGLRHDCGGSPCNTSGKYVGAHEVGHILNRSRQRVDQLSRWKGFPEPAAIIGRRMRVWETADVEAWAKANGRMK